METGSVTGPGSASPYEDPELYDLMLDHLDFDVSYWTAFARDAGGPVLEVGCGTGRVLIRLLDTGVDADGVDNAPAMLERARARARALGHEPALVLGDMRDFTMPRRYARAFCAFNSFAHMDTSDDQIRALRCVRQHLDPGGVLAVFMSYPGPDYWSGPEGEPVLETETTDPRTGHRFQLWDTRERDVVGQRQRSLMELRELDASGAVVATRVTRTTQRWVYRYELELLFRLAGYARTEVFGGLEGEPLARADQPMVAWGWTP